MAASDVAGTLELALEASGRGTARVRHRPRLLSDDGPGFIAAELARRLDEKRIGRIRGAPCRPQTQGRTGRRRRAPKNRILLESHHLPGGLEARVAAFVGHCDHSRAREGLNGPTPADICLGRGQAILQERRRTKRRTIQQRRLARRSQAA